LSITNASIACIATLHCNCGAPQALGPRPERTHWDAPGIDGAQANASNVNALSYRVILEPDADDGGFNVVVPAFPTAHTQGDDVEDAMRNAREVIELELGYLAKRGLPIPPSDVENVRIERVSVAPPAA